MINADKKKEMKNLSEMLLETRGLTKRYGHHKAVDSVIKHIKKGAIYGFIGFPGRRAERLRSSDTRERIYRKSAPVWDV